MKPPHLRGSSSHGVKHIEISQNTSPLIAYLRSLLMWRTWSWEASWFDYLRPSWDHLLPALPRSSSGPLAGYLGPSWAPKLPQGGPFMAPRGTKIAQDFPKMAPRGPKIAPRAPRWPRDGPKMSQDGPKRPQDDPKMAPKRFQGGPR